MWRDGHNLPIVCLTYAICVDCMKIIWKGWYNANILLIGDQLKILLKTSGKLNLLTPSLTCCIWFKSISQNINNVWKWNILHSMWMTHSCWITTFYRLLAFLVARCQCSKFCSQLTCPGSSKYTSWPLY